METYFQKIKRQNSAYIVFRYCKVKKDSGEKLTKEEQDFLDEYLKLNYK